MTWKYGLIKIAEEDGEVCHSEIVELYSNDTGEFTSFCAARFSHVKDVEVANKQIQKDGLNNWFYDNGEFIYNDHVERLDFQWKQRDK